MNHIDQVFGPTGILSAHFPGYQPREGQIAFATATDTAITSNHHLIAECPTGTGKSIGYLVPAVYHAATHEKRALVVTANIALQEQLVSKDLPMLAEILPWNFTYALMKGRRNFLCLDKHLKQSAQKTLHDQTNEGLSMMSAIEAWAKDTKTGDMSELPFEPPYPIWSKYSVGCDECKRKRCVFYDECFAKKHRDKAHTADIVVCNYHMLCTHLAIFERTGGVIGVLPEHDIVILDEAHKLADIARDFFGYQITDGMVRWASGQLVEIDQDSLYDDILCKSENFFMELEILYRSKNYRTRLREKDAAESHKLVKLLMDAMAAYRKAAADTTDEDEQDRWAKAGTRCGELALGIHAAMELDDENYVYFLEERKHGIALCGKPIDVAEQLKEGLFDEVDAAIVTSATLMTHGSFEFVTKEIGLEGPQELVVESPFDYAQNTLLVVPKNVPDPRDDEFRDAVAHVVEDVIELAGGRTLGLFTSYRNLDATYERVADNGYRVLKQGELPRTKLIAEFKEDVSSVLLGTESFWAGVDVPGESLSCVVIDKLPFPGPDDPVLDIITTRDDKWFANYSIPRAIIAFKQGFGRLIRSVNDRGVVVVLDRRIIEKAYGRKFTKSIPRVLKSRSLESVRQFLKEVT